MQNHEALRILVFKEDESFIAQCLEFDICTAATSMDVLRDRMDALMELELSQMGKDEQTVDQAPERFHKMWEQAIEQANNGFQYRLAA